MAPGRSSSHGRRRPTLLHGRRSSSTPHHGALLPGARSLQENRPAPHPLPLFFFLCPALPLLPGIQSRELDAPVQPPHLLPPMAEPPSIADRTPSPASGHGALHNVPSPLFPPWSHMSSLGRPRRGPCPWRRAAAPSLSMAASPCSSSPSRARRPCHYLAPSSRSELHRRPAQQAARCCSSHEIPSVSPASTRSVQRCRSTAAAPCCR
jgi:hypothetical protein